MNSPCFRWRGGAGWQVARLVMVLLLLSGGPVFAAGGGHDEASPGWLMTDTYRVMNFVVLAGVLFWLLKKPVSRSLNGRIEGIREELSALEEKKKAAEVKLAEYDARMAELGKEEEALLAEYVRQGEDARLRILREAEAAAEKLKEQADKNIDHEFFRAKTMLKAEVVEKALARAEAVIRQKINSDDQEKLVDEYLEKVVAS